MDRLKEQKNDKKFKLGYISICKNNFDFCVRLSENKSLEMEIFKADGQISFGANFSWTWHRDHGGIKIDLNFLNFEAYMEFRDNRHWDNETNCWENYCTKYSNVEININKNGSNHHD